MKHSILYILIIAGLIPTYLFGQVSTDYSNCYEDSIKGDESVFTKIQINASFKGGQRAFQAFLIKNIDHNKLIKDLSHDNNIFKDTVRIKFIISKYRTMSNLIVDDNNNITFQKEIEQVIKQSACFWEPGNYSGRLVNGWYQYDIFYFAELKGTELNIRITFKLYDFVETQQ